MLYTTKCFLIVLVGSLRNKQKVRTIMCFFLSITQLFSSSVTKATIRKKYTILILHQILSIFLFFYYSRFFATQIMKLTTKASLLLPYFLISCFYETYSVLVRQCMWKLFSQFYI